MFKGMVWLDDFDYFKVSHLDESHVMRFVFRFSVPELESVAYPGLSINCREASMTELPT